MIFINLQDSLDIHITFTLLYLRIDVHISAILHKVQRTLFPLDPRDIPLHSRDHSPISSGLSLCISQYISLSKDSCTDDRMVAVSGTGLYMQSLPGPYGMALAGCEDSLA